MKKLYCLKQKKHIYNSWYFYKKFMIFQLLALVKRQITVRVVKKNI